MMAEKQPKETLSYKKERDSFLNDLQRFHHNRRTPYQVNPSIRGKDVDLYQLYTKVTAAGGWEKVNEEGRWEEFASHFNLPEGCTNADQALKRIYIRYLDIYERIHHRGEDPDKQDEYGNQEEGGGVGGGLTPGSRLKRSKNPLGGVALKYNYQQHKVPPHLRHNYGLSTELMCPSAYAKLEQALLSGLPNEVDFAFNICTLLSNEGKHTLQLNQCPLILHYLLAHVAICNPDDGLLTLHEEGWKPMSSRNFQRFWYETVKDPEIRSLILPNSLENKRGDTSSTSSGSILCGLPDDDNYSGVLNVGRELGLRDKEGQRALQLAIILRNLSFEKGNMFVLSNTNVVFRFLMLCIHSDYGNLRQLALDTLSNMALQMVLEPLNTIKTRLTLRETARVISSPDKYEVISGLDLLARLCQVEENEELLSDGLEQDIYDNIVHYLTVHDIQLIVYTLECLYQLSELGDVAGTHIAMVRHAVGTLVSLVTIEAQSYGPESLRGIKVVEHVPVDGGSAVPAPAALTKVEEKPQQAPQPVSQPRSSSSTPIAASTAPIPTAVAAARAPPMHASGNNGESTNISTCVNWLEAHYEAHDGFMLPRMDLYTNYIHACANAYNGTMQAVANAVSFANCVRMAFPTLELVKVGKADGATDFQYRGLRRRPVPKPFAPQGMSRPQSTATPSPPPGQRAVAPRPSTSTSGESTLIKSLLASKLQQNMQKMQTPPNPTMSPHPPQQPTSHPEQHKQSILQQQLQQPQPQTTTQVPSNLQPQQLFQRNVSQAPNIPSPSHQTLQQFITQTPQVTSQTQHFLQQSMNQLPQVPTPPQQITSQPSVQQIPQQQITSQPLAQQIPQQQITSQPPVQQIPQQQITSQPPVQQIPQQQIISQPLVQQIPQQQITSQLPVQQIPQQQITSQPPVQQIPAQQQNVLQQQQEQHPMLTSAAPTIPDATNTVVSPPAQPPQPMDTTKSEMPTVVSQPQANSASQVSTAHSSDAPPPSQEQVEENGPSSLVNGVCSPDSSHPPTPLSLNPEEEDMDIKECDESEDKANNSIEEKKARIKKLMQDTKVIRDTCLTNGLVCHDSNGDEKLVKENGLIVSQEKEPVLENGCPSPASTPPVNGHNGGLTSSSATSPQPTPVISDTEPVTINNNATPPTPDPTPELPSAAAAANNPCVQPPANTNTPAAPSQTVGNTLGNPAPTPNLPPVTPPAFVPVQQQQPQQQAGGAQHVVIQQGGQQHVVQLGQPLAQQLAQQQPPQQLQQQQLPQQPPQPQQQQQQQMPQQQVVQNGQQVLQQQYLGAPAVGGLVRPPVLPPHPPPQQVLQVQVPAGQQVMQVRMPPSNGQPQILHVHVPQGPGQPPHVMQVSIPPAPNGQAQTVQVQVRPNTPQVPRPLPPYPASHIQQQQGQPQQPPPQQGTAVPTQPPRLSSPGQQHPLLQQHLQNQQPPLSPTSSIKRPPTPTQPGSAAKRKRPLPPTVAAKKGKRTDSADSNQSAGSSSTSLPSPALPTLTTFHYMCEWKDCHKPSFESQKECHKHVMCEHFDRTQAAFRCAWDGCDGLVRGRWSFVQHLQDRHLCEQALKAAALRRQQQQASASVQPPQQPLALPPPPVYPNDAALQAIRRFAIKPPYQQFVESKEGPVTKHIRLTSALILRNLARYSSLGRSLIKQHEQHLAYVAFSTVEASNALSHCLSELQKH